MITGLMRDDAEQVQCIRVVGIGFQRLMIEVGRAVQIPASMRVERLFQ